MGRNRLVTIIVAVVVVLLLLWLFVDIGDDAVVTEGGVVSEEAVEDAAEEAEDAAD